MTQETRVIRCQGFELSAPQPYSEGHTVTQNEANVLNQTLVENLRNNFASRLRSRQEEAAQNGETYSPDLNELQAEFDEYIAGYEFGVRPAGGGGGRAYSPEEREARKLARQTVSAAIQAKGHKIKDIPTDKMRELVEAFYEQNQEALLEQAASVIAAQESLAGLSVEL